LHAATLRDAWPRWLAAANIPDLKPAREQVFEQLDDEHLREMAGTFSRRLHAFCAKQGIPLIEAHARARS
jgi:hypothetical protein